MSEVDPNELARVFGGSLSTEPEIDLLARPAVPGLPTVGIWRVRADSRSVVLKILRYDESAPVTAWSAHAEASHPFYWRREADALAALSSLSPHPGEGLRPPDCLGVFDRPDGSTAIWLEDVGRDSANDWKVPRYRQLARDLAIMQARTRLDALITENWPSRNWLRSYVDRRVSGHSLDDALWSDPRVRAVFPAGRSDEVRALWTSTYALIDAVEASPQTLCQIDFHPANLFDVGGESVAIDWAYAGIGGIGEDLGTLLVDAATDFHLDPRLLPELFEALVDGYAEGAGADPAYARETIAIAALARYSWLPLALASSLAAGRETINRRPAVEAASIWSETCEFVLELFRTYGVE